MFGLHEEKFSPHIQLVQKNPIGSSRFKTRASDRKISLLESSIKFFRLKLQSILKIYLEQLSRHRQELMCQFEAADRQMTRLEYELMYSTTVLGAEALLQKAIQAQNTLDQILGVLMELDVLVSEDSEAWQPTLNSL